MASQYKDLYSKSNLSFVEISDILDDVLSPLTMDIKPDKLKLKKLKKQLEKGDKPKKKKKLKVCITPADDNIDICDTGAT